MSRSLGVTTVTILSAIQSGIRYGLDIVNRTELLPGTVYTTLRRLERRGSIEGHWEDAETAAAERRPRRRYYRLTPAGDTALAEARDRLASLGVDFDPRLSVVGDARAGEGD
jgi:DNA-binding PadR family transcriptional regulator